MDSGCVRLGDCSDVPDGLNDHQSDCFFVGFAPANDVSGCRRSRRVRKTFKRRVFRGPGRVEARRRDLGGCIANHVRSGGRDANGLMDEAVDAGGDSIVLAIWRRLVGSAA